MKLVESSIRYPVTVVVVVLIAALGGGLALTGVPIQLSPDIAEPKVTVSTAWPGASPEEVEKEIVDEQEELLKSVEGVIEMRSESHDSLGMITLEFAAGTDLTSATVRVNNKLGEVLTYPENALRPVVTTVSRFDRSMAWMVLKNTDGKTYTPHLQTFLEDTVKARLERLEGVASVNFYGGLKRQLQVVYDPALLASTGIQVAELAAALQAESQDISAGDFGEGKRRYVVRTMGRYRSPKDVEQAVVSVRAGVPIRIGDIAEVKLDYEKPQALVRVVGQHAICFNIQRRLGANVLEVMTRIDAETERLTTEVLAPRGLELLSVFRNADYIESAINRVLGNMYLGALLAILVLYLFLRSLSSILVVGVSIPISVITSFLTLYLLGRTINVISLAGMAFAVGMVVDNAIVVLENIYRHLQEGKSRIQAAHDGTVEVWGAIFASTVTTVAVFLPILFIEESAGQLFRDLALAIASAIVVSLVVALTVIPTASARVLKVSVSQGKSKAKISLLAVWISGLVERLNAGRFRRLAVITTLVTVSVVLTRVLLPSAEYLPNGNQNFLFGLLLQPPGYNTEEVMKDAEVFEHRLTYLLDTSGEDPAVLPGGGGTNFWFAGLPGGSFFGLEARDPQRARELVTAVNQALTEVPGALGFASQASLFSTSLAGSRSVTIDVTGPRLEEVLALAGEVFGQVGEKLPGSTSRPIPGLDLGNPEVRIYPDRVRAADAGLSTAELGRTVNSLIDGMKVAEYFHDGQEIDVILKGHDDYSRHTQSIANLPLATPTGEIITLGDVAEIRQAPGPVQINHAERQRVVSIETALPDNLPLEEAMLRIENEIVTPLKEAGRLDGLYDIHLSGAADDLSRLRSALGINFVVVLALTFLLLAALFQSFAYPAVIMLTVPLATLGGVLGLRLLQVFVPGQQLDVLTMLGFVILVGTVINNSILIVYQALHLLRGGESLPTAVRESVRVRVRPILMSTMTSSLGMLPLVVLPGAGSELYRGLGAVVVGGLLVSTVITLILTPLVFSVVYETRLAIARQFGWEPRDFETAVGLS